MSQSWVLAWDLSSAKAMSEVFMNPEEVAYRMFVRDVASYAHPAMIELAWVDPEVRAFWIREAEAILADNLCAC